MCKNGSQEEDRRHDLPVSLKQENSKFISLRQNIQFREMKMRTALVNEEEKLKLLPLEAQCDRIDGVWNLSSDQVPTFVFVFYCPCGLCAFLLLERATSE